ncbi:MAG: hypothetical protein Q8N63_03690 [Nanoarchaeota archaeon]|nr:hypothetical protein [Nanoarchaeota archaeon]
MKDTRYQRQMPQENARKLIRERLGRGLVGTISGKDVGDGELKEMDDIPGAYVGTRLNYAISNLFRKSNAAHSEDRVYEWESVWMKGSLGETFSGDPYASWCRHVTYHIPSGALIEYGIAYSGCDDHSFEQVRVYGKNKRDTTTLVARIMEEVRLLTEGLNKTTNGEK